jgi:ribosome-binding ATPase
MKISLFSVPGITPGRQNVKDSRLDQADQLVKAKKKTYIQVELVSEDVIADADAILTLKDSSLDLILKDLEFVETRIERSEQADEKALLGKLKAVLEKEQFASAAGLTVDELQMISGYGLLTIKPVIAVAPDELEDLNSLLVKAVQEAGFISFFTVGDKENRAWLIKKGASAWEASGTIHSDIQKGFIRAEIISFNDFIECGGESQAKQAGKMRLEQKDYIMQDVDLTNFRFNK